MGAYRTSALKRARSRLQSGCAAFSVGHLKARPLLLALGLLAGPLVSPAPAVVRIELGSTTARPGESTQLTAVLVADGGEEVAAVQLDLTFDPDQVAIGSRVDGRPDCEVEPSIDKGASGFGYRPADCQAARGRCSRLHAVIVATDNVEAIGDGTVLYRCQVDVPFDARAGRYPIRGSRVVYAQPDGRERGASAIDAAVTVVGAPLDTPTPQPTATPESTPTPRASGSGGGGCELHPPNDSRAHAEMLWLITLPFLMAMRRSRTLMAALWIALVGGLSPAGAAVSIDISEVVGVPGAKVEVHVTLTADAGEAVAGTQNDLRFDPAVVAVGALESGAPDCAVNPAINKMATAFGFRPAGCDPGRGECTAVRALVLAFDNVEAIGDGAVLYTCQLLVAADVAPGQYELINTRSGYAPPEGGDRPAVAHNGLLVVQIAPTDTPAPTATMPPTTPVFERGDANCDGRVDHDDLRAVVAAIFTRVEMCNADCNRDGAVNGADLVCITRHRLAPLGLLRGFPTRAIRSYGGARARLHGGK